MSVRFGLMQMRQYQRLHRCNLLWNHKSSAWVIFISWMGHGPLQLNLMDVNGVWKDSSGKIQLMDTQNVRWREAALHTKLEAMRWAMESMLEHSTCQHFGADFKDLIAMIKESQAWPNFARELEVIQTLQIYFPDFKISYTPREQNGIADSLARTARSFNIDLCFIGCSIPT